MMIQQAKRRRREEEILLRLDDLTYATRKQLQVICGLGGDRNAHRILHAMEKDKLISSIRSSKKIYFLSNKGKETIGSGQGELKRSWITHTLMRNDLYIQLGMPEDWRKEVPVKMNGEILLVADAMFTRNGINHFVEVDNQQTMRTNGDKIKKYKELFTVMFSQNGYHPVLVWCAVGVRKNKLQELCKKHGIKFVVY